MADGGTKKNSNYRICAFFRQNRGVEENAEFIKDEYGRDGKGFIIDGQRIAMWFDDSGIRIAAGNTAIDTNDAVHLSWEQAARRVRELLDMGRYLPQKELDQVDGYERKMIAEKLWYLDRDCRDGYSILKKQSRRGFPEETAYLAGQLTNRAQVEKMRDRMKQFIIDYAEDESILRFRYHRPFELYEYLDGMLGERLNFTSDVESRLAPQLVITQDVIDKEYNLSLQGKLTHSTSLGRDVYGNIQRIDNVLAGMEDRLKACRQQLEDTEQQLETAKVEAEKQFIHEEELAKKSARLSELNTLLNMDKKDNEILCEAPEEEPEKQTEEHER